MTVLHMTAYGAQKAMAENFTPVFGRCECSAVRYRVDKAAEELYHCHCSRCRRLHGALFATYAYVKRKDLEIEQGSERLATYRSPLASFHFCGSCGCHLFAEHDHNPGVMWYMPATLEGEATPGHATDREWHIFVESKSPIEKITDDLPQYDEYAPEDTSVTSRKTVTRQTKA